MRNDFAVLILSHGRAREMKTVNALKKSGYTGKWYIVIDNEDDQEPVYRELYGEHIYQFDKRETAKWTDAADNIDNRKAILWARNQSFYIAKELGLTYFMMNDDDFSQYNYWLTDKDHQIKHPLLLRTLDDCIESAIKFLEATNAYTVAFAQGGDFIGGTSNRSAKNIVLRKCMNTFICRTDKPFQYYGRMNEDVTTYVRNAMLGNLMFTITPFYVNQADTQTLAGGMSEEYKNAGTYTKSFYSVMYAPSAVSIGMIAGHVQSDEGIVSHWRIHHSVHWDRCAVKIIQEKYKKK